MAAHGFHDALNTPAGSKTGLVGSMSGIDRRQAALGLIAAVASADVLAGCVASGNEERVLPLSGSSSKDGFYTPGERIIVDLLADAIIPATETPGAIDAGVPATMDALMSNWASQETQAAHRAAISRVGDRLRELAGTDLQELTREQQASVVGMLDEEAYAQGAPPPGIALISKGPAFAPGDPPVPIQYRALKGLIAQAYYASEPGAAIELQYELVPGRWVADAPLGEIGRTWAE